MKETIKDIQDEISYVYTMSSRGNVLNYFMRGRFRELLRRLERDDREKILQASDTLELFEDFLYEWYNMAYPKEDLESFLINSYHLEREYNKKSLLKSKGENSGD
jgi:hypothetical protein